MNKIINWMGGWPKEGLVSASEWEERLAAAADRFRRDGESDSARSLRREKIRQLLAQGFLRSRTSGKPDRIKLTAGADAALGRLAESLHPGDVVLTERLTSRSALQVFRKASVRVEAVAGDGKGMDPDALKSSIALHRPKLVYAAPVCSDPLGKVWDAQRIADIIRICRQSGVAFLRDDRQEALRYEETKSAPGRGAADRLPKGVMSIGQIPPGVIAGLRLGWIVAEPATLERWFPSGTGAGGGNVKGITPLEKAAFAEWLADQPLEPLLEMLRVQCERRMLRITELLTERRVPGLAWKPPEGGIHLWLKLPDGLDGEALLRGAWIKGLMFQPGAPFYASNPERNTLRLTFAYADERQMKQGVARLTEAMGDFMGRFDIG